VKQKSQASAKNLSVRAVLGKVVDRVLHSDNVFDGFWSGLWALQDRPPIGNRGPSSIDESRPQDEISEDAPCASKRASHIETNLHVEANLHVEQICMSNKICMAKQKSCGTDAAAL